MRNNRERTGVLIATFVLLISLATLGPTLASAAFLHPVQTETFGPDGTSSGAFGTPFGPSNTVLAIDQTHHRLYVQHAGLWSNCCGIFPPQRPRGIYGFDISAQGEHPPLGGGFPITLSQPVFEAFDAVDEADGNIYYLDVQSGFNTPSPLGTFYGYDESGSALGGSFPVNLTHRVGDIAVDPLGYVWMIGRVPNGPPGSFEEKLYKYSPDGTLLEVVPLEPLFATANELIFDRLTGDLWVDGFTSGGGPSMVRLTASSGYTEYDRRFSMTQPDAPGDLAIDAKDKLLYEIRGSREENGEVVVSGEKREVVALNESGAVVESLGAGKYRGIAVDESTGDVYLNDNSDDAGEKGEGGKIRVWDGVVAPDVNTGPPTTVGHSSATLSGHVDPAGGPPITDCGFQYARDSNFFEIQKATLPAGYGGSFKLYFPGETASLSSTATAAEVKVALEAPTSVGPGTVDVTGPSGGPYTIEFLRNEDFPPMFLELPAAPRESGPLPSLRQGGLGGNGWKTASTAPCVPPASPGSPISEATDVQATVSGLETGKTYYYRLIDANVNGQNIGTSEPLSPQPSLTVTGAATGVQRTAATLNGTVDPEGLGTTFYFEYGKTREYGHTSAAPPGVSVGSTEAGAKPVSSVVESLSPGATYHYRLVAVNSSGTSYGVDRSFTALTAVKHLSTGSATAVERDGATLNGTLDPDGMETHYYFEWGKTRRYGQTSTIPPGAVLPSAEAGDQQVSFVVGSLKATTTYHYRLVASNAAYGTTFGADSTFTTLPAVVGLATEAPSQVEPTAATLHGRLDPDGYPTTFYFEWGKTPFYGHTAPAPPGADVGTVEAGSKPLSVALAELEPGTVYHFRLVGVNSFGTTFGQDRSFATPQAPSIEGVFSSDVTSTSADLKAQINPNGVEPSFETTYRFEYGTTSQYGSTAPVPDGTLAPTTNGQSVTVPLNGLAGVTYHFRLIAESQWGTTTSEDQTFEFNPPGCPNAAVRQQTGAAYLPDCRAYELVSPARAGGAALYPQGPTSSTASNRFAFVGSVNAIPGAGEPPNAGTPFPEGDLYVASRTTSGWGTRYVGIPAGQTIGQAGVPDSGISGPGGIPSDRSMSKFLTWKSDYEAHLLFAPYVFDNEGDFLGRLPSNLEEVPGAAKSPEEGGLVGATAPSADFSHYTFSSRDLAFAPGGLTTTPGSAYDDATATGAVNLVSKTAAGLDIPQDGAAGGGSGEYIRIPAVSAAGSHILMSTAAPGGTTHLYMRVNDAVSYDVSLGEDHLNHGVSFAAMSEDGTKVYFTTAAQMTADDHDTSVDLYRWEENGGVPRLTRLSVGSEGFGNSDACNSEWTTKCSVEVVPTDTHEKPGSNQKLQPIDNATAADGSTVYFYSPEELDGSRGVPGKRNLYVWHAGTVHHVAALDALNGAERIDVSPDGSHTAFITKTQIGSYNNAGHAEMYSYEPSTRRLLCVSCHPDGSPPQSDVQGSQNGIFMTDDGRTFFSTADALVPRDANGIADVYEYVDGRAQLISTGTGDDAGEAGRPIGLVGVSADGTNAFISTYQTLVGQDENGPFYKFYDARVNGGFPFNKPAAPCAAADECHGEGSSSPAQPQIGSGAQLEGGNASVEKAKKKHHKKHHRHAKPKRRRHHGRAGR
jgi:hypothetical protein